MFDLECLVNANWNSFQNILQLFEYVGTLVLLPLVFEVAASTKRSAYALTLIREQLLL